MTSESPGETEISKTSEGYANRSGWNVFRLFLEREWLQSCFAHIMAFVPILALPIGSILAANLSMVFLSRCAYAQLSAPVIDLGILLRAAAFMLAVLVIAAPLLCFGLAKLVFLLTAFCRFWLVTPKNEVHQSNN